MLFALARRGDAPQRLVALNGRGVPVNAILLSVSVGFLSVIFDAISPDKVFLFTRELLGRGGPGLLPAHRAGRAAHAPPSRGRGAGADEAPDVLFPWLTYVAIAGMVAVIVAMAFVDDVRSQLIPSFLSLAVVLAAAFVRYRQSEARGRVRTSKKPGAYGVPRAG